MSPIYLKRLSVNQTLVKKYTRLSWSERENNLKHDYLPCQGNSTNDLPHQKKKKNYGKIDGKKTALASLWHFFFFTLGTWRQPKALQEKSTNILKEGTEKETNTNSNNISVFFNRTTIQKDRNYMNSFSEIHTH